MAVIAFSLRLQQCRGISWPTGRVRLNTIEAEVASPEFIDKNVDSPDRIVVADIIVE
jgi:hypothetical protein